MDKITVKVFSGYSWPISNEDIRGRCFWFSLIKRLFENKE